MSAVNFNKKENLTDQMANKSVLAVPDANALNGSRENENFISGEPTIERMAGIPEIENNSAEEKLEEMITEAVKEKEHEIAVAGKDAGFLDESINTLKKLLGAGKRKPRPSRIPQVRDTLTIQIEHIMEEGLQEAYKELSTVEQQNFKIKGEETAWEIRSILKVAKFKIKTIFRLLLEWLKLLPGVNRFFLEQEAKIKVDKIVSLKNNKMK